MENVQFVHIDNITSFSYVDGSREGSFDYRLPVNNDFNISFSGNYEVELLINPTLNKERHHFTLRKKNEKNSPSIGIVFPISMLDGTEENIPTGQLDYFVIAFYILLKRLNHIKDIDVFSKNFEPNVCVCVFNINQVNEGNHLLAKCIHSLRGYNYSYFIDNNNCQPIKEYKDTWFIADTATSIPVSIQEPPLYSEKMVDAIMRIIPNVNNIIHRFFISYQIIEFLIARTQKQDIDMQIMKYRHGTIPENDFFEEVAHIKKEGAIIKEIFAKCALEHNDFCRYVDAVKALNTLIGYKPKDETPEALFYSFRNQMTHSLRNLIMYDKELARTIFEFERVVMQIIRKYP